MSTYLKRNVPFDALQYVAGDEDAATAWVASHNALAERRDDALVLTRGGAELLVRPTDWMIYDDTSDAFCVVPEASFVQQYDEVLA